MSRQADKNKLSTRENAEAMPVDLSPHTDKVLKAIRQVNQAIDLHSHYLEKQYGVTGPQLLILREVQRNQGISVSELAQAINLSISTVTGIVVRLEKKGFVLRNKCEQDKRRVLVKPTEKCNAFIRTAPQPLQDTFIKAFSNLDEWEQLMIISSLQRLVLLMKAEDIDVSPILASGPIYEASSPEKSF